MSLAAVLPIVRVTMKVFHRPNHDDVTFDCVINAVWKAADEITPDIVLEHAPNLRAIENGSDTRFNFIDKGVTQSGDLLVVIAASRDEFGQCFLNEAVIHFRTADRAFLRASVPSTSRDLPARTAARRFRTSSKWARSTAGFASPERLARSFSTNNARPLVGRLSASSATISTERAMLKGYISGHRLQGCSLSNSLQYVTEFTLGYLRPSPSWKKEMEDLQPAKDCETMVDRLTVVQLGFKHLLGAALCANKKARVLAGPFFRSNSTRNSMDRLGLVRATTSLRYPRTTGVRIEVCRCRKIFNFLQGSTGPSRGDVKKSEGKQT